MKKLHRLDPMVSRRLTVVLVLTTLSFLLRFWGLNDKYLNHETFVGLTGGLELLKGHGFSYEYYGSIGPALVMVVPFAMLEAQEWLGQATIAFYGVMLTPLAYWFALKYGADDLGAILLSLSFTLSPFFLVLSRVGEYDIIGLLFSTLFLVALESAAKHPQKVSNQVFLAFSGAVTILMKITNAALVVPLTLFFAVRGARQRDFKQLLPLMLVAIVVVIYLFIFPTERTKLLTSARGSFGMGEYVAVTALASMHVVLSPLHTPKQSAYFYTDFQRIWVQAPLFLALSTFIQFLLIILGFRQCYKRRRYLESASLVLGMAVFPCLFTFYKGWQARYLLFSIFLALFLSCLGVSSLMRRCIREMSVSIVSAAESSVSLSFGNFLRKFNAAKVKLRFSKPTYMAVFLSFVVVFSSFALTSFYTSASLISDWGSTASLNDQNILISIDEGRYVFKLAVDSHVDVIASSMAVWFNFYSLWEQSGNIMIFDVYRHAVYNGITLSSVRSLTSWLRSKLDDGLKVWYIATWMELTYYSADETLIGNFHDFLSAIEQEFRLETIFVGKNVKTFTPGIIVYNLLPKPLSD